MGTGYYCNQCKRYDCLHSDFFKAEQESRKKQQVYDDYKFRMEQARIEAGTIRTTGPLQFDHRNQLITRADCIAVETTSNSTTTIVNEPDKKLLLLRRKK